MLLIYPAHAKQCDSVAARDLLALQQTLRQYQSQCTQMENSKGARYVGFQSIHTSDG